MCNIFEIRQCNVCISIFLFNNALGNFLFSPKFFRIFSISFFFKLFKQVSDIYLKGQNSYKETGRESEREFIFTGSLPKWLQRPGLVQAKA